jgi:TM2 domain-containing membrane protein YozV
VNVRAHSIVYLGETMSTLVRRHKDPGIAAVLSLLIPGVGQFYNGEFLRGIFWLIVTPGFWIGTAGLFGWPFHIVSAITAYHRAKVINRRATFV